MPPASPVVTAPSRAELKVFNCGLHGVARRFPEACVAEVEFLEQALGATLERREHIAGGCNACTYHVQFVEEPAPDRASARFDMKAEQEKA